MTLAGGTTARTADDQPGALRIRFNQPSVEGDELELVAETIRRGHTACSGPFSAEVSTLLRDALGSEDVILTTSCTDALEMAGMLLDIQPGDTVVVPSFTFVSTALAFARQGARILFCDIERDTLGLDPQHLVELLDPTVRAVVPVHYAGVGCNLDGIADVLADHPEIALVEDNAHGLFGSYRDRPLGSFGRFSTLSFHETKNFICGEGGALVVNRDEDVDRAHRLRDKGTDRRRFDLGLVDKYSWQDTGSSFGLSDVLAAYLLGQLRCRDSILTKRRAVFDHYWRLLEPVAAELGVRLPYVSADREQAYHMFYVLMPDSRTRDAVLRAMAQEGVHATFHYVPLHSSSGGRRFSARPTECPVSDEVSGRLLRLPFYNSLTKDDVERVVKTFVGATERAPR